MKIKCMLLLCGLLILAACKKEVVVIGPSKATTQNTRTTPIAVPNGDFENWNWQLRPVSWFTNGCPLCVGAPFDEYQVRKDSELVYHGNYSAELIYNYYYQAYGKIKFALSTHPTTLQGYVACHLYNPDTVTINIKLFKNKHLVDSGQWQSTTSILTFTQVNILLTNNATAIDTALITITGGKTIAPNGINSTTFWVDDLMLYK